MDLTLMDYELNKPFVGLAGLVRMAEEAQRRESGSEARNGGIRPFPYQFYLSYLVITTILGLATGNTRRAMTWAKANILPSPRGRKKYYLDANAEDFISLQRHLIRCIELAELIYNLQSISGINPIIRRLVSNPTQIEATVMELEGIRLLWTAKRPFRLVHSGAGQGLNYECEVILPNSEIAFCEMKCKVETATFSASSVGTTLSKARRQLPSDKCGVVILKIPDAWARSTETSIQLESSVLDVMRQSARLCEVICYIKTFEMTDTQAAQSYGVKEFINETSPYSKILEGGLIQNRIRDGNPARWWRFSDFKSAEDVRRLVNEDLIARGSPDGLEGLLQRVESQQ